MRSWLHPVRRLSQQALLAAAAAAEMRWVAAEIEPQDGTLPMVRLRWPLQRFPRNNVSPTSWCKSPNMLIALAVRRIPDRGRSTRMSLDATSRGSPRRPDKGNCPN